MEDRQTLVKRLLKKKMKEDESYEDLYQELFPAVNLAMLKKDLVKIGHLSRNKGMTKEEDKVLDVCLSVFGVGNWQEMKYSGCLPGKTKTQIIGRVKKWMKGLNCKDINGLFVRKDWIIEANELPKEEELKKLRQSSSECAVHDIPLLIPSELNLKELSVEELCLMLKYRNLL